MKNLYVKNGLSIFVVIIALALFSNLVQATSTGTPIYFNSGYGYPTISSISTNNTSPITTDVIRLTWEINDSVGLFSTWITLQNSTGTYNTTLQSISGTTDNGLYDYTVNDPNGTLLNFTAYANDTDGNLVNSNTLSLLVNSSVSNVSVVINRPFSYEQFLDAVVINITAISSLSIVDSCVYSFDNFETNYSLVSLGDDIYYRLDSTLDPNATTTYNVSVSCSDLTGIENNTEYTTFNLTITDPSLTVISPLNDTSYVNAVKFTVQATDVSGVNQCTYTLDNSSVYNTTYLGSDQWTRTDTSISSGQHYVQFSCTDNYSNIGYSSINYFNVSVASNCVDGDKLVKAASGASAPYIRMCNVLEFT